VRPSLSFSGKYGGALRGSRSRWTKGLTTGSGPPYQAEGSPDETALHYWGVGDGSWGSRSGRSGHGLFRLLQNRRLCGKDRPRNDPGGLHHSKGSAMLQLLLRRLRPERKRKTVCGHHSREMQSSRLGLLRVCAVSIVAFKRFGMTRFDTATLSPSSKRRHGLPFKAQWHMLDAFAGRRRRGGKGVIRVQPSEPFFLACYRPDLISVRLISFSSASDPVRATELGNSFRKGAGTTRASFEKSPTDLAAPCNDSTPKNCMSIDQVTCHKW